MPKILKNSTIIFIVTWIVSIYLLSLLMNIFASKNYILFSPISWYISIDKKPLSGITVTRSYKWGYYANEGKESVITDKYGYFSFSNPISIQSRIISIVPHEAVITQRMFVDYQGKEIQIYWAVKRDYELNGEYGWKPLKFIFDPTQDINHINLSPYNIWILSIRGWTETRSEQNQYEFSSFPSTYDMNILPEEEHHFTLDADDEQEVTKILSEYLQNNEAIQDLWKYRAQYFGFMNANNEKVILANFFCSTISENDWKKNIVFVLDWGNCYFQIKVNLVTKAIYDFEINKES